MMRVLVYEDVKGELHMLKADKKLTKPLSWQLIGIAHVTLYRSDGSEVAIMEEPHA